MQRKCACGGVLGPTGECAACRRKRLGIQPKLTINQPGDKYEREADRVAEQVMRMSEPHLQRQPDVEHEDDELIQTKPLVQRKGDNQTTGEIAPPIVQKVLSLPGQPLDPATRGFMEPRLGHSFSQVRVHTGAQAAESARAVNASAYTVGRDVVFGAEQYRPNTMTGKQLLAHELTHVIQQSTANIPQADIIQRRRRPNCEATRPVPFHDTVSRISGTEFSDSFSHLAGTVNIQVKADYDTSPGPVIGDCDEDYSVQLMQCDLVFDNEIGGKEVACIGHSMSFSRTIPSPGPFGSGPEYYFRIKNGSSGTTITTEIDVT